MRRRLREFNAQQREFNARSEGLVAENTAELKRLKDDIRDLLDHVPGRVTREKSADITTAERQSFYRADLVAKGEDQQAQRMRKPAQGDP